MCGRFARAGYKTMEERAYWDAWLRSVFKLTPDEYSRRMEANYNVAPTTWNPVVHLEDGQSVIESARWGLIPAWWSKPMSETKLSTFNARSEEAAGKPFFRDAMKKTHCLVPALGYYEWLTLGKEKQPFFISANTNSPGICFAGLWSYARMPDFEGPTFTILTRASEQPIDHIHDRQPIMLFESSYDDWLAGAPLADVQQIPQDRLKLHAVGKAVGNSRAEGAELMMPVAA